MRQPNISTKTKIDYPVEFIKSFGIWSRKREEEGALGSVVENDACSCHCVNSQDDPCNGVRGCESLLL